MTTAKGLPKVLLAAAVQQSWNVVTAPPEAPSQTCHCGSDLTRPRPSLAGQVLAILGNGYRPQGWRDVSSDDRPKALASVAGYLVELFEFAIRTIIIGRAT